MIELREHEGEDNIPCTQTELTPRDWQLILTGADCVTFKQDQVIIEEGNENAKQFL